MPVIFERVLIAGVGLIGGSLGLAAKTRGLVREVVGFGRTEANLKIALERGLIDGYTFDPVEAARGTDLVLLAVPVEATGPVVRGFLPHLPAGCVVTDAGSVKKPIVDTFDVLLPPTIHGVAAHPIAGTEHAGAGAAFETLFDGSLCVLTPTAATDCDTLARVRALWEGVGMRVEEMDAAVHDRLLAQVSHLPHLIAFSVMNGLLDAFGASDGEETGFTFSRADEIPRSGGRTPHPNPPPQGGRGSESVPHSHGDDRPTNSPSSEVKGKSGKGPSSETGMRAIDPLAYAGSAFADLTRVAASPVEMWRDICLANRDALLDAITHFEQALAGMKVAVSARDGESLSAAIERARQERKRLSRLRDGK